MFCSKCNRPFSRACAKVIHERFCGGVRHADRDKRRQSAEDFAVNRIVKLTKRQLKKFGIPCLICGWNEARCDIHHIVERKNGGQEDYKNLILVCPNCHRVIHETSKYDVDFLTERNIESSIKSNIELQKFYCKKKQRVESRLKALGLASISKINSLRINKIKSSSIDFGKFGWVGKTARLLNMKPQKINQWMRRYMFDFYDQYCFKRH